jgi:hypothetical protein
MVDAFFQTGAFGVADLVFIVDADDDKLSEYQHIIEGYPSAQAIVAPAWQPLVPKLNRWAVQAANDYSAVAFLGDDHVPRTTMWAHQLIEDHSFRGHGIVYGRDGHHDEKLPTWWSMGSFLIKALGRMVPAPVQHLYCDNSIKVLGEQTGQLFYDERILIEHMHPAWGKAKEDAQYKRVNRRQQYNRDEAQFKAWVADGLAADVQAIAASKG